jgi:hypothetical protein
MVEENAAGNDGGGRGVFFANRDARSFWRDFLKPVLLRTTKNNEKDKTGEKEKTKSGNRREKKVGEAADGGKKDASGEKSSTFGPPSANSVVDKKDPEFATKNHLTTATTTEPVPTAIPISDDYEIKMQQHVSNQQNLVSSSLPAAYRFKK